MSDRLTSFNRTDWNWNGDVPVSIDTVTPLLTAPIGIETLLEAIQTPPLRLLTAPIGIETGFYDWLRFEPDHF